MCVLRQVSQLSDAESQLKMARSEIASGDMARRSSKGITEEGDSEKSAIEKTYEEVRDPIGGSHTHTVPAPPSVYVHSTALSQRHSDTAAAVRH